MRRRWPQHLAYLWLVAWFVPAIGFGLGHESVHHLQRALGDPSLLHPLGFDAFGRDLLMITLQASARSALFALIAAAAALFFGLAGGTLIAIAPERLDFALSRGLEALLAFPSLLLALAWAAVRGPGWDTLVIALLLGSVPTMIRLTQSRARELMTQEYILAAQGLGASSFRIAARHLTPNLMSFARVKAPNLFASALMAEATLSFLGIGAPIGHDSWGTLLAQGKDYLLEAPHLAIGVGIPLVLTVLSLQLLSESLSRNAV